MPLAGNLSLSVGGKVVHAFGVADRTAGVAYLLHDLNETSGTVSGSITIGGLATDAVFDIEVWSTDPDAPAMLGTVSGVYSGDGSITFDLPAFAVDAAIKFKARPNTASVQEFVAVSNNGSLIGFFIGPNGQPMARIIDEATGAQTIQDISGIGGFRGVARDLTAFTTSASQSFTTANGPVHLAVTDTENNVWIFSGRPLLGQWTATNITQEIGAPGLSGDLTFYLPTWGSLTIAGLDARGHAVAYWYNVGAAEWNHFDYTAAANGPALAGGLTGFVTSWDALNLVGLTDDGDVVAYWWVPGQAWDFLSMTSAVAGPALSGQLSAFTTSWNAMNIVGMNDAGEIVAYWWSPARTGIGWTFTNLSRQVGAPPVANAAEAISSPDNALNIFGVESDGTLQHIRWTPSQPWTLVDTDPNATAPGVAFPLAAAAGLQRMVVFGTDLADQDEQVIYSFDPSSALWTTLDPLAV